MAKVKTKTPEVISILPQLASKEDKNKKEGGLVYCIATPIKIPGFNVLLSSKEVTIEECNDGWFAVVENGDRKHYRLGPKFISEVRSSLGAL